MAVGQVPLQAPAQRVPLRRGLLGGPVRVGDGRPGQPQRVVVHVPVEGNVRVERVPAHRAGGGGVDVGLKLLCQRQRVQLLGHALLEDLGEVALQPARRRPDAWTACGRRCRACRPSSPAAPPWARWPAWIRSCRPPSPARPPGAGTPARTPPAPPRPGARRPPRRCRRPGSAARSPDPARPCKPWAVSQRSVRLPAFAPAICFSMALAARR